MGVGVLDLAKTGCPVKCEFQKSNEYLFSINMS